jgi:hypothetical protein
MIQVENICVWGIMQEGLLYFKIDMLIRAKIIKVICKYKMGLIKVVTKKLIKDMIIMLK